LRKPCVSHWHREQAVFSPQRIHFLFASERLSLL
jgi:hypothetical protein